MRSTGKHFEATLKGLGDLDIVGEVRGSHFMIGIEFVKDKETKEIFDPALNIGLRVARKAQARGLIARPLGHILILSPTLILTPEQMDTIGAILRESILDVMKEL